MRFPRVNAATNVPVDVAHSGGTAAETVDQQTNDGQNWSYLLGTYSFDAGTSGSVTIRTDATDGYVVADAVRFLQLVGSPLMLEQVALSVFPEAVESEILIVTAVRPFCPAPTEPCEGVVKGSWTLCKIDAVASA